MSSVEAHIVRIADLRSEVGSFLKRVRKGLPVHDVAVFEFFEHINSELEILGAEIEKLQTEAMDRDCCDVEQRTKCAIQWLCLLQIKFGERQTLFYIARSVFRLKFFAMEKIFKINKSFISRKVQAVSSELPRFLKALNSDNSGYER
jgi:hypothetical protein